MRLQQNGQTLGTATTDATGQYVFAQLEPGTYSVQVVAPPGYTFSPKDQGGDESIDSDVDVGTGTSAPVALAAGQNVAGPDAGLYQGVRAPLLLWLEICSGHPLEAAWLPGPLAAAAVCKSEPSQFTCHLHL